MGVGAGVRGAGAGCGCGHTDERNDGRNGRTNGRTDEWFIMFILYRTYLVYYRNSCSSTAKALSVINSFTAKATGVLHILC